MYHIVCVCVRLTMMANNNIWECADPGAGGGTQQEVECLKGYGTIKSLGTAALAQQVTFNECSFLVQTLGSPPPTHSYQPPHIIAMWWKAWGSGDRLQWWVEPLTDWLIVYLTLLRQEFYRLTSSSCLRDTFLICLYVCLFLSFSLSLSLGERERESGTGLKDRKEEGIDRGWGIWQYVLSVTTSLLTPQPMVDRRLSEMTSSINKLPQQKKSQMPLGWAHSSQSHLSPTAPIPPTTLSNACY